MGWIGTTCSQCIQFLPMSKQQGIAVCHDVWKGSNNTNCKVTGTTTKVLRWKRKWSWKWTHLGRLYSIVVENICRVREKKLNKDEKKKHTIKVNDMVLVRDPDSAVFEPRYQPNFWVTAIYGDNRIEVQDEKAHRSVRRSSHVKYVELREKTIQQLPEQRVIEKLQQDCKTSNSTEGHTRLPVGREKKWEKWPPEWFWQTTERELR